MFAASSQRACQGSAARSPTDQAPLGAVGRRQAGADGFHPERSEEWLGLHPSQTGSQTTLPGLSRSVDRAREGLSTGLMGGCVRGESVVADDAPGTGGTLWVQLSLPLIRFPERIPAGSERITDGVTSCPYSERAAPREGRPLRNARGITGCACGGSGRGRTCQPRGSPRSPARERME